LVYSLIVTHIPATFTIYPANFLIVRINRPERKVILRVFLAIECPLDDIVYRFNVIRVNVGYYLVVGNGFGGTKLEQFLTHFVPENLSLGGFNTPGSDTGGIERKTYLFVVDSNVLIEGLLLFIHRR
jgi:hypothetical protein